MESFQIKTGQISVNIMDDDGEIRGVFKFNPADIGTHKKFIDIQKNYIDKQKEYMDRAEKCETDEQATNLLYEIVEYLKDSIDTAWGKGSSEVLFGNASTLTMFEDFFANISPFYQREAEKRMSKYQ